MNDSVRLQTQNRADLSQFLIHLTKDGTYEHFQYVQGPPLPGYEIVYRSTKSAKTALEEIIQQSRLEARGPFGFYKLKINKYKSEYKRVFDNGGFNPDLIKSVCFSEVPLTELKSFYQATTLKRNKYKKYGLGFFQEKLREKGANPVFYVDSRQPHLIDSLNTIHRLADPSLMPLMHLIDTFGPPVIPKAAGYSDFRWEREWRKKDSLDFSNDDIAFGICPEDEIDHFESLAQNQMTFFDPDWDQSKLKEYLKKKNRNLLSHI